MKKHRDDPPTSYLAFANLHEPPAGGRFAGVEPRKIVGASANYEGAPQQPGGSPWSRDVVPDEPSLGVDLSIAPDLGEPLPSPQSLPASSTADGERRPAAPASSPVDRGLRHLQRRA
jgi:hypothetical protein